MSASPPRPLNERALLFTLAGIQFTHIVDFMVVMPLGPLLTRQLGLNDAQFGLLVSAYTLAAGASGLLVSGLVDRYERSGLLLRLYLAFALATLCCGLAPNYPLLLLARVAAGVCGGVLGNLAMTIVGDAVPFERRGAAMGRLMGAFSLATIAGVPGSLWLAEHLGWHAPFFAIALASLALGAVGRRTLPRLDGHLRAGGPLHPGRVLRELLSRPEPWRAFLFSAVLVAAGFIVIPFLTMALTANAGVATAQVPLLYLAAGAATAVSSALLGRLADRWGKVATYRAVALLAVVPVLAVTHLGPVPLGLAMLVTTAFFVLVSGRMVPSMALITAAVQPAQRGAFMNLNGAVQATSIGLAALAGGLLVGRDAQGRLIGYALCGWISVALTLVGLWVVGRLRPAPAAV